MKNEKIFYLAKKNVIETKRMQWTILIQIGRIARFSLTMPHKNASNELIIQPVHILLFAYHTYTHASKNLRKKIQRVCVYEVRLDYDWGYFECIDASFAVNIRHSVAFFLLYSVTVIVYMLSIKYSCNPQMQSVSRGRKESLITIDFKLVVDVCNLQLDEAKYYRNLLKILVFWVDFQLFLFDLRILIIVRQMRFFFFISVSLARKRYKIYL